MARSQKTQVIEYLFNKHWNETSGVLDKTLMSLDDVAEAIPRVQQAVWVDA